LDELVLMN